MKPLKLIFFILILLVNTYVFSFAQTPQKVSYQSVIRNTSGELVRSQAVGIRISILQGSATGTAVYVETQTPQSNVNGLVSIEIGSGTPVTNAFAGINWARGPYFLKLETDPSGGTTYTIIGTTEILSVPYALLAKTAETATGNLLARIEALEEANFLANGYTDSRDGNHYNVVKIGNQLWMTKNLKTTQYNDGTPIPNVTDNSQWANLTTGAFCNYANLESNAEIYGRLYNWYAVNTGKLAPAGWHVATDAEWTELFDYLTNNGYGYGGSGSDIAKSLCAKTNWNYFEYEGTPGYEPENNNSTGFTALPGGFRSRYGDFFNVGDAGDWWSSTEYFENYAYGQFLDYNNGAVYRGGVSNGNGMSVRLVKD